jgi:hypothetical protein
MIHGARGRAAVKANTVNTDGAAGLPSRLAWVDDGNVLGTTALRVLDSRAAALAGRGLLAGRSIRHAIVELQVAVELHGDLELIDGESRDGGIGAGREAWAAGDIG